jgi:DNA-binding NtrC family response regulator
MTTRRDKGKLLVVDDDEDTCMGLVAMFDAEGYVARFAADGEQALAQLEEFAPDVVLTDLVMPKLNGIELIERGVRVAPHASFVIMTASHSVEDAVRAMKRGAENFLTKPLELDTVSLIVERACAKAKLSREAAHLRARLASRFRIDNVLGESPLMQRLLKTVAQIAPSRATVLIHGETGTGKELIAAAIHQNSPRKDGPYVRLNCASLTEGLLESELFGHERGAFTGAVARREGRFKQAHEGTLFLDEVSEIPLPMQVKLLRFIQERQFERVGGNETITVDVRVVAATNCDLSERVRAGRFREDLFYRLNVVQLNVPALRLRKSDIPLLAAAFLQRFALANDRSLEGFSEQARRALLAHSWPGNVRELENAVESAVVLCPGSRIELEHLPATLREPLHDLALIVPGVSLAALERLAIEQTLKAVGGSTSKAAEILGISGRKIQYKRRAWEREAQSPIHGEDDDRTLAPN